MKINEYVKQVIELKINEELIKDIQSIYGSINNNEVKAIVSNSSKGLFFDDKGRLLSYDEIKNANKELNVDFSKRHLIPIFDMYDNDFIIYDIEKNQWEMFNIVDDISFEGAKDISDLLIR